MSRRPRSPSLQEDGRPLKQAKLTFFASKKKPGDASATQDPAKPANQPKTPLKSLLDLSEVEDGQLQARFDAIAEALIHHSRLQVVNGDKVVKYQILEAEFYLRDSARHWDPFTHGEEEQRFSGRWYFHRVPRWGEPNTAPGQLTGYRGGTRKGLDLTVGGPLEPPSESSSSSTAPDGVKDVRGGILLRTIKNEADGKVTCGPSLLVDELLRAAGAQDITHMVQSKMQNDRNAFFASPDPSSDPPAPLPALSVVPHEVKSSSVWGSTLTTIYTSPRIGLELSNASNSEARIQFVDRPYRYFIHPKTFSKKGQAQTFAGLYRHFKAAGENVTANQIGSMIGIDVGRFLTYYTAGRNSSNVKDFVGPPAKGTSSAPDKYLRMLGALEKRREEPGMKWEYIAEPRKNSFLKKGN
ncbi:hypothetical protein M407DRAFT_218280 [Tulasnella calospora MUT 4182]|uniref:Uncharacterized protein n=1 Tax=Tulasnella calospora MUT 4182 TaxID=1051891 RepID=A0A0C3Q9Q7_9AGAM|nr:hypothetical protein M407DRAFT_218280 [Tulasnella calospora MUT 4182]